MRVSTPARMLQVSAWLWRWLLVRWRVRDSWKAKCAKDTQLKGTVRWDAATEWEVCVSVSLRE